MRNGEVLGLWAQDTRACRGIIRVGRPRRPIPCWGEEPVIVANSAAADPPFYFVATGRGRRGAAATGLADNPVIAGRLVGILWVALSMWSPVPACPGDGRGPRPPRVVVAARVLLVPAFLQQYTFITPHALDIPVGAFAALATLRFLRREWPWWTLVLAGLGVAGVKGSNIVIVVGARRSARGRRGRVADRSSSAASRPRSRALVGGGGPAGRQHPRSSAGLLWMLMVRLTQVADPPPPGDFLVDSLDPATLVIDSIRFLSPFGEGPLGLPSVWFMMAMAGYRDGRVGRSRRASQLTFVRQLAPGYLLGAALGADGAGPDGLRHHRQYIGIHLRYGLAIYPLGLAFFALLLRTRTSLVMASVAPGAVRRGAGAGSASTASRCERTATT